MKIEFTHLDQSLLNGVCEMKQILNFELSPGGIVVETQLLCEGLKIEYSDRKGIISYHRRCDFFRALGLFVESVRTGDASHTVQIPFYSTLGAMFDCSRNGVMNLESAKKMIRHMALMGYDSLMLYTEDTFEIKEYPYFGYLRGRYSAQDIRIIDDYAGTFGIELIPCIQTLAHMNSALRWPCFSDMVDVGDILLADSETTYEFLDKILGTLSGMFRSKRINIGMDEAHLLGRGRYLDRFGYKSSSDIMMSHLGKVVSLCKKHGFEPMMWSDMFFRMLHGNEYIGNEEGITDEIVQKVPKEVSLIHWDYYSTEQERYDRMSEQHSRFGNDIVFAGGAWKWIGFAPGNRFSYLASIPALKSCHEKDIRRVLVTVWGDDGAECALFAILPVLQLFAESSYTNNTDISHIAKRFKTCVNGRLDDFFDLDLPNLIPGNDSPGGRYLNPSKYLFYQDPLLGLYDLHIQKEEYTAHFRKSSERLRQAAPDNPDWKYLFDTMASFCDVLEFKGDLGVRIKDAYDRKDNLALGRIACEEIPEIVLRTDRFRGFLANQWQSENKVFGFEVLDLRIGGLIRRLQTAVDRIEEFLAGRSQSIDELEQERLYFDCRTDPEASRIIPAYSYRSIVSVANQ